MSITHVFGQGAAEYISSHKLNAVVALTLNAQNGANGQTPTTKRHILITPGTYSEGDFYLGQRAYVTVEGAPEARPILANETLGLGKNLEFTLRNLELRNCCVSWTCRYDAPSFALFDGLDQHSQRDTRDQNGFVNANRAAPFPQTTTFKNCTLDGGGSQGNTMHGMYIEGRPGTKLVIEDSELYGADACSMVKSTCSTVEIRRNKLYTRSKRDPRRTAGSILDIVAATTLVVADNEFELWRNVDSKASPYGLRVAAIHRRNRREMLGSDTPAYPNVSWDPPVSTQGASASSPGGDWSKGPETYVDPAFWQWVEEHYDDPDALFCAYVSGNTFRVPADSRPNLPWLRDDGTRPVEAAAQFASKTLMLRAPDGFRERSITYHALNRFEGAVAQTPQLEWEWPVVEVEEGACYPRSEPWHYPRALAVPPAAPQLPDWFLQ